MLQVNPETVCRLVELAQSFHVQEQISIPDQPNSPAEDWSRQMLADHADNTSVQEFRTVVEDLEPDQQQEVMALMWLGRGDFTLEEWEAILTEAEEQWTPETADYLLMHPMLADYLLEGLDLHGYHCQETNMLHPTGA
ncbi:DUF3775 domain-containing protein [Marinobacter sp.]|uniref:DUF3775 domain-containing protein n=1 Tax=Marinobacter sp. TaxID=50741 RepID=UPI003850C35B